MLFVCLLIAFDLYDTCIHHETKLSEFKKIFSSWVPEDTIMDLRNVLQTHPVNIEDAWFDIPDNLVRDINNLTQKNIESTVLYPDTLDTLEYLKERWYKLALISNLAKKYEKPLRDLIPNWTFDYEALSFKVWDIKPNPWIFSHIRDVSWIDFKNMVMVWDKLDMDVNWAQNVWMNWIQVDRKKKGWIHYAEDYIRISTLSDLKKLFK